MRNPRACRGTEAPSHSPAGVPPCKWTTQPQSGLQVDAALVIWAAASRGSREPALPSRFNLLPNPHPGPWDDFLNLLKWGYSVTQKAVANARTHWALHVSVFPRKCFHCGGHFWRGENSGQLSGVDL